MNDMSPLFDLKSPAIRAVYDASARETEARASKRDLTSWREIRDAVSAHIKRHGDGSLILICGAAFHIYGAVPEVERTVGARYLSTTPRKLDLEDVRRDDPSRPAAEGPKTLRLQMDRANGVAKSIGYQDLLAFMAPRPVASPVRNIAVGIEETGLHSIYLRDEMAEQRRLYAILTDAIKENPPRSILYVREELDAEEMAALFSAPRMKAFFAAERDRSAIGLKRRAWEDFLLSAKFLGIPIYFGAFGILDRATEDPEDAAAVREIDAATMEIRRLDGLEALGRDPKIR